MNFGLCGGPRVQWTGNDKTVTENHSSGNQQDIGASPLCITVDGVYSDGVTVNMSAPEAGNESAQAVEDDAKASWNNALTGDNIHDSITNTDGAGGDNSIAVTSPPDTGTGDKSTQRSATANTIKAAHGSNWTTEGGAKGAICNSLPSPPASGLRNNNNEQGDERIFQILYFNFKIHYRAIKLFSSLFFDLN